MAEMDLVQSLMMLVRGKGVFDSPLNFLLDNVWQSNDENNWFCECS